eukprot:Seg789.1 transcript_id=Seg789.1/GoldUCD/mRNA.D3Y31 product="hypothetical protein" protein_id=Seg789.1/GoldUCD/D3Y31
MMNQAVATDVSISGINVTQSGDSTESVSMDIMVEMQPTSRPHNSLEETPLHNIDLPRPSNTFTARRMLNMDAINQPALSERIPLQNHENLPIQDHSNQDNHMAQGNENNLRSYIDVTGWHTEVNEHGRLIICPDGTVVLPPGTYDGIMHHIEQMMKRTDFQRELELLKDAMITEFGSLGRPVIYDPDEFEAFCRLAGATSIFFNMVSSFFNHRQSATRHQRNRKAAVAILYKLVFTLSQRCNFMQKENTLFMITNNLNKDAINTERSLASACSSRTGNRMLQRATENGWLIVVSIDDYTSIHTHRRAEKSFSARNMATIVVSIFKDIPAISWNTASAIHIPDVPRPSLKDAITDFESMHKLKNSYPSVMPRWLTQSFFDALATQSHLNARE